MAEDKIIKTIELNAPLSRVWRAISDSREFGEWFRVKFDGPFVAGKTAAGYILHPGYEHVRFQAEIQRMESEKLFSFTWHPYAIDPAIDYSGETPTLVEFRLEPTASGTRLTVTESGFENVPAHRRAEAFRMNEGGWAQQIRNIESYLARS